MTYNEFLSGAVYTDKYQSGKWRFVAKEDEIFGCKGFIEKMDYSGEFRYEISIFRMDEVGAEMNVTIGGAIFSLKLIYANLQVVFVVESAHIGHA